MTAPEITWPHQGLHSLHLDIVWGGSNLILISFYLKLSHTFPDPPSSISV